MMLNRALLLILTLTLLARAQQMPGLQGVWEQRVELHGQLVYMSRVQMELTPQGYRATTLETGPACGHPVRTSNHRFDGRIWTCDSDWEEEGTAHFTMERVSPDRFEGWATLDGKRYPYRNVWTRS